MSRIKRQNPQNIYLLNNISNFLRFVHNNVIELEKKLLKMSKDIEKIEERLQKIERQHARCCSKKQK